jgi:tRNA(Ile2) C34 agmatinyltransferase TiaS
MVMEKYGVELDKSKVKEAGKQDPKTPPKCPTCDEKLDNGGACPTHGTEPLEKKERD